MSKRAKIQQERLDELEAEFQRLLIDCLKKCEQGRWGLFGQNDDFEPEGRYRNRADARRLIALGEEIRSIRTESGQGNERVERFFELRSMRGPQVPGEPKLATFFWQKWDWAEKTIDFVSASLGQ